MMDYNYVKFSSLVGKTLVSVVGKKGDNVILLKRSDGMVYKMFHRQDCCESVFVEDICGDIDNLLDTPVLSAEEVVEDGDDNDWGTSTWTFYKLSTAKGDVTIRWYGESNGYYSESVDFVLVEGEPDGKH